MNSKIMECSNRVDVNETMECINRVDVTKKGVMMKATKSKKVKTMTDANGDEIAVKYLDKLILKREKVIAKVFKKVEKLEKLLEKSHLEISAEITKYLDEIAESENTKWKGNATLRSFDESHAIEVQLGRRIEFDERLQLAAEKINEWIEKNSEKITDPKSKEAFEKIANIAKRALNIDQKGKVDHKKVIQLKTYQFNDPEWKDAIELIEKSMTVVNTKSYHKFKRKDKDGKFKNMRTNYSDFSQRQHLTARGYIPLSVSF